MHQEVMLPDVQVVMYVESASGLLGASEAFDRLETRLPTLKGREFYGTFQPPDGPYRACVAIEAEDDTAALGLSAWVIPGGKYRRRKLVDWQARVQEIGTMFASMAEEGERDLSRPSVEFYRSDKEVVLFLPIK
jgi:hypothetical protein